MAIAPPVLTVKVEVDTNSAKLATQKAEAILLEGAAKAEAKRTQISTTGNEKRAQNELNALQKQKLSWEKHLNSIALAEEKARLKSLKGQESWSAKMTKSLDSVAMSIRGIALAWGSAQLASALKNAISFAGSLGEQASGLQVTTQQYFALSSAMRDAGAGAERLEQIFARLNNIAGGGASTGELRALSNLGIANPETLSNIDLFDKLVQRVNSGLANQADLGTLLGNKMVAAFNRIASSFSSFQQISDEYKFPLTEDEIKRLDAFNDKLEQAGINLQLMVAKTLTFATDSSRIYALAPVWVSPYIKALEEVLDKQESARMSASRFGVLMNAARSDIEARRNFERNGMFTLPEQTIRPRGGDNGMPPRNPARPSAYGSGFGAGDDATLGGRYSPFLTGASMAVNAESIRVMARELPTITRELDNSSNFADTLAESIQKFGKSDTWQVANAGAQAFNSLLSMQATLIQNEVDALQMIMQMESQRWQERTRQAEAAGIASSAAFRNEAREHEKIEKQRQKKLKELQSKGWEQNKLSGISNTIMSTAQGVMQAFASPDLPAFTKLIMAGLVSATGAAQIAMISSQKNPYKNYAFGGYVPGQSLGDDTMINVTGGEFVNNRQSTQQNRAALEFANKGGIIKPDGMSGGITVIIQGDIVGDDAYVESRLIPRLQRAIDRGYKLRVNG